ncbi:transmembrane protein 160 [Brachionichthys hirsutus]|uniref:transmembrane protein 160 n=1 Tax=Brachionichthys hirsutus TaxID=412623 RepID=UPI00360465F7
MASLRWFVRRQLSPAAFHFARKVKLLQPPFSGAPRRKLCRSPSLRLSEADPWGKTRGPEQPYRLTDLDKADASMLRKSHETGFLSWFRNGLLATGVGVIAYVQSEIGREAGYAFFMLGGVCVSFGCATYIGSLFALRRMMMMSAPMLLLQGAAVGSVALFWFCAVSIYIGRLKVEIIHEDEEGDDGDECQECRGRREHRGRRDSRQDNEGKGPYE